MSNLANFVAFNFNGASRTLRSMRSAESLTKAAPNALVLRNRIRDAYLSTNTNPLFMSDMTFVVNDHETIVALPYMKTPKSSPTREHLDINFYFKDNVLSNIIMLNASYDTFENVGNVYVTNIQTLDFDWDKKLTKVRIDQLIDAAYKAASVFDRYGEPV